MSDETIFDRLETFWGELVRRRVVHVAGVYAIVSWIVVYMVGTTYEKLFPTDAVLLTVVALIFLGFPVVLVLAWYFRRGRGGVHVRRSGGADAGAYRARRAVGNAAGAGLLAFGILLAGGSFLSVRNRVMPAGTVHVEEGSVAVLPFANLSGQDGNRYFSDGMTEEVIARLARIPDLKVISRTCVLRFWSAALGPVEIGRELGDASLLEGSVQPESDRLRGAARVVDTESVRTVWAESYDRALEDVFAIQTDLVERIATSLGRALADAHAVAGAAVALPTRDFERRDAWFTFLRGSPWTEPLHDDPRFADLLAAMDLEVGR